jgi:hypothetical protein
LRKVFKYVLLAVIAINLAILLWVFLVPPPPRVVFPNPNGYDDFLKAARLVTGNAYSFSDKDGNELAALIETNAEALKLARGGLEHECLLPIEYSLSSDPSALLTQLKQLGLLFGAEGRLVELQGHTNEAANIYLEGMHFGQEVGRGGAFIFRLVGIACETISAQRLMILRSQLDAKRCREILHGLEQIDTKEEPIQTTMDQERRWNRKVNGVRGQLMALFTHRELKNIADSVVAKVQGNTLSRRTMIIAFAARAYELDKGKPPQNVADLVPGYLKAVPKDPATGRDLSLLGK